MYKQRFLKFYEDNFMIPFSEECENFGLSSKCEWQGCSFDELMQPYMEADFTRPFVIARLHKDGKTICVEAIKLIDQLSKNVLSSYSQVDFFSIESNPVGLLQKTELGSYKRKCLRQISIPSHIQTYVLASSLEKTDRVLAARKKLIQSYFKQKDREQERKWLHCTVYDFPQDRDSINRLLAIVEEDKSRRDFFLLSKLKELQSMPSENKSSDLPVLKRQADLKKETLASKSSVSRIAQACTSCLANLQKKLASCKPKRSFCPSFSMQLTRLTACCRGFFSKSKISSKQHAKNLAISKLKQRQTQQAAQSSSSQPIVAAPQEIKEVEPYVEAEKISMVFHKCLTFGSFSLYFAIGEYAGLVPQLAAISAISLLAQTKPTFAKYGMALLSGGVLSLACRLKIIELF